MPSGYASSSSASLYLSVASAARDLDGRAICSRPGHLKIPHRGFVRKAGRSRGAEGGDRYAVLFAHGRGLNVSRPPLRMTVQGLLGRGSTQHELERMTWLKRAPILRIDPEHAGAKSPGVTTGSDGRDNAVCADENPESLQPPRALAARCTPP